MNIPRFHGASALGALALAIAATQADAQATLSAEVFRIDGNQVTVYAHDFLDEIELETLRAVGRQRDALALFMGDDAGHGAIAVAPREGFLVNGAPAPSASALAQLPDPDSARAAALEMCDDTRRGGAACVVVLEVAPLE